MKNLNQIVAYFNHEIVNRTTVVFVVLCLAGLGRGATVVLDPGHGGGAPGAVAANGATEKNLNLAVCRMIRARLEGVCEVVMTRDADVGVSLAARAGLIRRVDPDLVVSVHCDGSLNVKALGQTVYVYPGSSVKTQVAAALAADSLAAVGSVDRGVRAERFRVLAVPQPAMLIEMGFLSNVEESAWLQGTGGQRALAGAIADAVAHALRVMTYVPR